MDKVLGRELFIENTEAFPKVNSFFGLAISGEKFISNVDIGFLLIKLSEHWKSEHLEKCRTHFNLSDK